MRGPPCLIFWWDQDFNLNLEALISELESDSSTALVKSLESWEVGPGG